MDYRNENLVNANKWGNPDLPKKGELKCKQVTGLNKPIREKYISNDISYRYSNTRYHRSKFLE